MRLSDAYLEAKELQCTDTQRSLTPSSQLRVFAVALRYFAMTTLLKEVGAVSFDFGVLVQCNKKAEK